MAAGLWAVSVRGKVGGSVAELYYVVWIPFSGVKLYVKLFEICYSGHMGLGGFHNMFQMISGSRFHLKLLQG